MLSPGMSKKPIGPLFGEFGGRSDTRSVPSSGWLEQVRRETREERQDGARCPIHESPLTRRKGDDSEPKRRGKDVVAHEGEGAREEEGGKEFLLSAELPPSP